MPPPARGDGGPVGGAGKTSLADIRKRREAAASFGDWTRVGVGAVLALLGSALLAGFFRQPDPRLHPQYQEALRVLRGDGLEASDANLRAVLQIVDAATGGYDPAGFRRVDPNEYAADCAERGSGICRRPPAAAPRAGAEEGWGASLLPLNLAGANVSLVWGLAGGDGVAALLAAAQRLEFRASPTNHEAGQEWRSSSSAIVARGEPLFDRLAGRGASLCGVPASFVERLQVVRYLPGERYQPHLDSEGAHHRRWTMLLYLNDPGGGGDTGFPLLRTNVAPAAGVALLWDNLRQEGDGMVRNYHSLHDGQAPTGAEPKYAVNIWVRSEEYREA